MRRRGFGRFSTSLRISGRIVDERNRIGATQLLSEAAQHGQLGSLAPFTHPVVTSTSVIANPVSIERTPVVSKLSLVKQPKLAHQKDAVKRALGRTVAQEKDDAIAEVAGKKIADLLEEFATNAAQKTQLEARNKELQIELTKLHRRHGKRFGNNEFVAVEIPGSHVSLDKKILLKLGVSPIKIEKATVKVDYTYTRVSIRKDV